MSLRPNVVFDQRGFPIIDDMARYDVRFPADQFTTTDYRGKMRMETRDLREALENNHQLEAKFRPDQIEAIRSGREKIPDLTWHHQDTGRMQLVPSTVHRGTGHIGGESMSGVK